MRPIHLRVARESRAGQTFVFHAYDDRGQRDHGWAYVTVNDDTGALEILSDWGNFQHVWGSGPHLGAHTLTHFLAGMGSPHYVVDKLLGKSDGREFSPTKTTEQLIEDLKEVRRDHISTYGRKPALCDQFSSHGYGPPKRTYLTHDLFEEICEDLRGLEDVGTGEAACALYLERLPAEIHDFLSDIWESAQTEETWASKHLRSFIVPAIVEACREETVRRFYQMDSAAQLVWAALEAARTTDYRHSLPVCGCPSVKSNQDCRGASIFPVGTRCAYWGSLCGATPELSRDGHGSQTDDNMQVYRQTLPKCDNYAPRSNTGHWRDWHRGHGCRLDPDAVAAAKAAESAAIAAAWAAKGAAK